MRRLRKTLVLEMIGIGSLAYGNEVTVYSPAGTVTGTYTTIHDGVAACLVGSTVSVAAGNHKENSRFQRLICGII
jgi:hypothetical protein